MQEYQIPKEHQDLPQEHHDFPREHVVIEEYPVSKPEQRAKKKTSSRRWMAMIAASFMTMQLMFTYFVPPTQEQGDMLPPWFEPSIKDPQYTDPWYENPDYPDQPSYDMGDFYLKAVDDSVDDVLVSQRLLAAAEHFTQFDYVRASLQLYKSMLYYDTQVDMNDLHQVGYTISENFIGSFGAFDPNAVHVYFNKESTWFENKGGELESVYGLRGTMVYMQPEKEGTLYRVLTVWISYDDVHGNYGQYTNYSADYIEGVFAPDGTSDSCMRTNFAVFESSYPDFDDEYGVLAQQRFTGSAANNAFLNGTLIETVLTYEEGQGIVTDSQQEAKNVKFDWLDENGVLILTSPDVVDLTTDNWEAQDQFYSDPTKRLMAYDYGVSFKFDGTEEIGWIGDQDIAEPLLPLMMHEALCIGQLVADQGRK